MENINDEFDGVFRFTNNTDEDFIALWNNKSYLFPANTRVPMIIEGESLENVQEIRKRFAKKLAEREYYKSKDFDKIKNGIKSKDGFGGYVLPSMYQEGVLQKWIDECLNPLPVSVAPKAKTLPRDSERNYKASKAVGKKDNLNEMFKDDEPQELGVISI